MRRAFFYLYKPMTEPFYCNPDVVARLEERFEACDWAGLTEYLGRLSNKGFRQACEALSRRVMVECDDDVFWTAFQCLLTYNSKAFLITTLKAVPERKKRQGFSLHHSGYAAAADFLNEKGTETDRAKFVQFLVANVFCEEPDELLALFQSLHIDSARQRMHFLIRGKGMGCYFVLFLTMRRLEHDKGLLSKCCNALMRKGDALSFNLACAAKQYFDLPEVRGTFSLRLAPYQLSRLETSYEDFSKVMGELL